MDIKMIYKGESFWGTPCQREDEMHYANMKHLSKCFRRLKADPTSAIHITDFSVKNKEKTLVLFWNTYSDQENGMLSIREYERWNSYNEWKTRFEEMKEYVSHVLIIERKEN